MDSGDHQQVIADEPGQGQLSAVGAVQNMQIPYISASYQPNIPASYQPNQMMGTAPQILASQLTMPTSQAQLAQHQLSYQHMHQQQMQELEQQLQMFWASQYQEINVTTDFKNHSLPLARIKKIMKADEDVRMIAAEAPVLFARACEMFILELTYRSWAYTEENKRRTLQKNDIAGAITRTDVFDFLVDIVPREEIKEEVLSMQRAGAPNDSLPYYYVPPQVGPMGMLMTKPEVDQALLYAQQSQPYIPHQLWREQQQTVQQQQQTPSEDS